MGCKSLMVELGKSGLRPCQVRKAVNAMKSPNEPTITSKQCDGILAEERKLYKGNEFYSLIKHFQEKAAIDTVDTLRAAEEDEDFKTMNSRPILSSIHPIEAKAAECYTKNIFELFQKEWIEATTNLTHETKSKSEEKSSYWVGRVNVDNRYKGGNAIIGIDETNSENGVSALALWYVQANLTKAIEQARDALFEIKRLNSFLVEFLEDQMVRKKPTEIENAYKDARVVISQVDMMPQILVRDPDVLTILKGRPRNATRVKTPIEVKQKKTVTCSYYRKPHHNITGCREKKAASMQEKK
ncbi:hypothetical protein Tco_1285228 [Tanacetum coccineum]